MSPEQEALVTDNLGLAHHMANRYGSSLGDEAFSEACVGLVHAARAFDPCKGVPFSAYAAVRIRGAMLDEIRRRTPGGRYHYERGHDRPTFASTDAYEAEWGAHPALIDAALLPDEQAEASDIKRRVCDALERLAPREAAVIRAHYTEDTSQAAIARSMGISPTRVGQIHQKALGKLRPMLEEVAT